MSFAHGEAVTGRETANDVIALSSHADGGRRYLRGFHAGLALVIGQALTYKGPGSMDDVASERSSRGRTYRGPIELRPDLCSKHLPTRATV